MKHQNYYSCYTEGGEKANGSADFEILSRGFRIQSEILSDFRILQLQRIVDSSIFRPRFWGLRVIKIFLPGFWIQGETLMADLVNES